MPTETKSMKLFSEFRKKNIEQTRKQIKESVKEDWIVVHATHSTEELEKIVNIMVKRLREWYSLVLPELDQEIQENEKYVDLVKKPREELMKQLKLTEKKTMGNKLTEEDRKQIQKLAKEIENIYTLKKKHEEYLEKKFKKEMPNLQAILGTKLAAKMITLAGSLKRLATLPSSTVQLLGAEKALFRHLTTGAKSPKHGILQQHPLINKTKEKGKAARALAERVSFSARLDYFKGEFKGKEYLEELEKKFR